MADADVPITAGSGTKIDTRTVGAGTDEHRQVVVIGDPTTAANVAIVDSSGRILSVVEGNVAHDAVDSGNPVKVGGVYKVSPSNVADGDRTELRTDSTGQMFVLVNNDVGVQAIADAVTVVGDSAHDASDSGNPIKIGGRASASPPIGVAVGDRVQAWFTTAGAQVVEVNTPLHATIGTALSIAAAFTTTQTSTNLIAGTGGQRIYVTSLTIAVGGTTGGRVSIYWGTGAFTAGTSVTLFDGEFAPSATAKPGAVLSFPVPVGGASATGDNLRITTSAAMTVMISGQAYKA